MQRVCTFLLVVSTFKGCTASFHRAQPFLATNIQAHEATFKFAAPAAHDLVVHSVKARKEPNSTKPLAAQTKPASFVQGGGKSKNLKTWTVSNRIWKISCDTHIKKHPDEITCPGNCPFLRMEPTALCQFKCVPATSCNSDNPLASFANPRSNMCEACKVAGCHRCGESRHDCLACQEGFDLKNGKCVSSLMFHMRCAFVVGAIVIAWVLYYLFVLFCLREEENPKALAAGLRFRELASTRHAAKHSKYSLWTDLTGWGRLIKRFFGGVKKKKSKMINGAGVALHFRWQVAIMVWAVFAMLLFAFAGLLFWEQLGVMHRPNTRKSYDACEENVANQAEAFTHVEMIYCVCVLILYLVTFLGSLYFAFKQRKHYHSLDVKHTTMKDFALLCDGFPIVKGTANIEEECIQFFKNNPQFQGLDIVGVSVCWNFIEKQHAVLDQVRHEFDIYSAQECDEYKDQLQKSKAFKEDHSRHSCVTAPEMKGVDAFFGIGDLPCAKAGHEKEVAEEVEQLLEGLESSGQLFLVFGNTEDRCKAYHNCRKQPLLFKDSEGHSFKINLKETDCEPHTVMWKGFGTPHAEFVMSLVLGCVVVFICVLILDLFFYAPYVIYILSYSDVPGMTQGGWINMFLLGLVITVCNQIIFALIGAVADKCSWTNADSRDCFYVIKYTLAVFFNTCVDLGTVLILAQGYSVDQAMGMQVSADSTMSSKAVAESPNMQKALYVQLVAYIFPSCTLLPILIEPIATAVLPLCLAKALVRSRRDVSFQTAEEMLMNPPYDLTRYGDILINMMLCCTTMVFTYGDLWWIFAYMVIALIFTYAWDQMRVLRFTTKTVFATNVMDDSIAYMMALPCGVLSACLFFKGYGALNEGFLHDFKRHLAGDIGIDRYNIFVYLLIAFWAHCIVHWLVLKFVVFPKCDNWVKEEELRNNEGCWSQGIDEASKPEKTYEEIGPKIPANYFNTNPVNCLRSKYVHHHDPPCIFYRIGKEHLIKKNPAIGVYYDPKEYAEEIARELILEEEDTMKDKAAKVTAHINAGVWKWADGV